MKKLLIMLVLLGGVFAMAGCSTLKGLGRDIEDAGDAVQDAVN